MAVYNGQPYLKTAIDSILGQTFSDFEFVIIDDASTDYTPDIIELSAAQDERIICSRNEQNIGLTRSLNKGLALARGDYIARMDADDISLPERLALQVKALDGTPEMVLVSGQLEIIDASGQVVHRPRRSTNSFLVAWYLLFYNYLGGHSQVLFRRDAAIRLGGYAECRPFSQDYEFWLRMMSHGEVSIIPEVVLQWRKHSENISTRKRLEQEAYSLVDSGNAINFYLQVPLSLVEVAELRDFWRGRFPNHSRIGTIHNEVKALYGQFCQNRLPVKQSTTLSITLSRLICHQFLLWAQVSLQQADIVGMVRALKYALEWRSKTFRPGQKSLYLLNLR